MVPPFAGSAGLVTGSSFRVASRGAGTNAQRTFFSRLRKGAPFRRNGGRRSRRRPASARDRGTSLCRSTPIAAEQRPSARAGQRFDLPAARRGTRLSGVIVLPRKTEDGGFDSGGNASRLRRFDDRSHDLHVRERTPCPGDMSQVAHGCLITHKTQPELQGDTAMVAWPLRHGPAVASMHAGRSAG